MQEIQVGDDYLRQEVETAAILTMKEPIILQVLADGVVVLLRPHHKQIGAALEIYLDTWDPQQQSQQDRIDDIALQFEEERMKAEQLVEIV
jgi:hypothetical protein